MSIISKQAQADVEAAITYINNHDDPSKERLIEHLGLISQKLGQDTEKSPARVPQNVEITEIWDVINEYEEELAVQWHREEPRIRYEEELDQPEVFQRFQEYITDRLARMIASRVTNWLRESLVDRYRDYVLENTSFHNFKTLYDSTKRQKTQ